MKRNRGGWREGEGKFWGGNEREGSLEEVWTYERREKRGKEEGKLEEGRGGEWAWRWGVGLRVGVAREGRRADLTTNWRNGGRLRDATPQAPIMGIM